MSRYQQAPYSDEPSPSYGDGKSYSQPFGQNAYGNTGGATTSSGNGAYGGYSDEPRSGFGSGQGGQGNGYGAGGLASADEYPMASTNPYATSTSQPRDYSPPKRKRNKWLWIGIPILLLIIIAAVLGAVLGTHFNEHTSSSSNGTSSGSGGNKATGNTALPSGFSTNSAAATGTGANGEVYLAQATDSYMLPVYATGTATSGYSTPTVLASPSPSDSWPTDPSPPSNSSIRDHPRLIAPDYKWNALVSGGLTANAP
ncbi:MAG: hypothetical protein TREMPRED_005009, partial [Tremellales sp. Tagirdzhanova-0007]